MNWDADRYSDHVGKSNGLNSNAELKLMRAFPPLLPVDEVLRREAEQKQLPIISNPCIVTDMHGNILLWSLPSVLPKRLQVRVEHFYLFAL